MRTRIIGLIFLVLLVAHPGFAAYENTRAAAVQWLTAQQNADGSWGTNEAEKFIMTVETVQGLRADGQRKRAYYKGITWLENHAADNNDYLARLALTLGSHGDDLRAVASQLESYQNTNIQGHSAWGVSPAYLQAPLDTALVLNSLWSLGTNADVQAAIDYLKGAQLQGTDQGWPLAMETSSDPLSSALVIKTLVKLQAYDSTLATPINNGLATLGATVNASSSAHLQAVVAQTALLAGDTGLADPLLASLAASQGAGGDWGGQVRDTALALRTFAAADGIDDPANQVVIDIPDPRLRAAINAELGHNALDELDRTELAQLSKLNAAGLGISDLTGLEWAINLTSADLRNNNITSTTPLDNLALLADLKLDGNPVTAYADFDNDIPTLPEWGMIIMACLLLGLGIKQTKRMQLPLT